MKLFDRIFHPEKVKALEECAKNWEEIYPMLTPEQYRCLTIPNKNTLITILPNINEYTGPSANSSFLRYFSPIYLTGEKYKILLKAKAQLDSLRQIGLTDEQKLYLEIIEGENNNE